MSGTSNAKSAVMKTFSTGSYVTPTDDLQLAALGDFLGDDCIAFLPNYYIAWALDATQDETGGNVTWLRKVEGGVQLSSLFDDTGESNVYLPLENFVSMLEAWKMIEATCPQQVRISLEGNTVELEVLK